MTIKPRLSQRQITTLKHLAVCCGDGGMVTLTRDQREPGELAVAGAAYAKQASWHLDNRGCDAAHQRRLTMPNWWPWDLSWWKPVEFRRDLVKACALIIAEGEKFDRNRKRRAA